MKKFFAAICAACLLMAGCNEKPETSIKVTEAKTLDTIKISVNGRTFTATLEDNPTGRAFAEKLPLDVDMQELNGNEKYFYLNENLPSNSSHVGKISAGDLMLFGDNCVVIFYKSFSTSYSYTRLGKINPADLAETLGDGNVHVTFTEAD